MSHKDIDLIKAAYAKYAARDVAGVFGLFAETIEIVQTPELPWGGHFVGHAGARQFFAILAEHTEALPRPERFIEAGNEVAVVGRLVGKARKTGKQIDLDIVHVWTLEAGKIVRFAAYIDTPAMLEALTA